MNFLKPVQFWTAVGLAAIFLTVVYAPPAQAARILGLCAAVFFCGAIAFWCCYQSETRASLDETCWPRAQTPSGVDPWDLQREVMRASDQVMPAVPALTKHGVMYAALNLEELGETLAGMVKVLDRSVEVHLARQRAHGSQDAGFKEQGQRVQQLRTIRGLLQLQQSSMRFDAGRVRAVLAEMPDFYFALQHHEAQEILDGCTDTAVVNCGLTLALGLPGAAAFLEVADSNLSKRNEDSGKIDKTPDGKWIKGPAYRAPDLARVLRESSVSYSA